MSITFIKADGQRVSLDPQPGTCRQVLERNQHLYDKDAALVVKCGDRVVDDEPFSNFDGQTLILGPRKPIIGG